MYSENELVGIAKRQNNSKRKYLVVNKLQGKHIPVQPTRALNMFGCLAERLILAYQNEKLLLIGFAETATAIAASVAVKTGCYYMQTTREVIEDVDYLFFTESHSHATEQKLVKNDIESIIEYIDRIVFVEDEVTTGNTILNIINILEKKYGRNKVNFSVASILNGMYVEAEQNYSKKNIEMLYLLKTNHNAYESIAQSFPENGMYQNCVSDNIEENYSVTTYGNYINARRIVESEKYMLACEELWKSVSRRKKIETGKRILVLGTEEFMFPALYVAYKMESLSNEVYFQATTRSPIVVSSESDYPLHSRFELLSLYDDERTTYIYDLEKYDCCYIITDSLNSSHVGVNSLVRALTTLGNEKIELIRWC